MIGLIRTVRMVSWMLEYSRLLERWSPFLHVGGRGAGLIRAQPAVELAALRHELAVDPLRWLSDFAAEKHWQSSDDENQQLQELIPSLTCSVRTCAIFLDLFGR